MGREIRRVPVDFDWPLNKVWEGFCNPLHKPCPAEETDMCIAGSTPAGKWLDALVRMIALIGEQAVAEPYADRLRARGQIFPHPYLTGWPQAPRVELPRAEHQRLRAIENDAERQRAVMRSLAAHPSRLLPFTEEMATLVTGLAGGEKPHFLQGCEYSWKIEQTLRKAAGIAEEARWGTCKVCDGHAIDPAVREAWEAWEKTPPPAGEGWQLWETVSEGSPVSPVFPTREAFVDYLVSSGHSRGAAEKFCETGWAPSGVVRGGPGGVELKSGIDIYDETK
jgi:hypothetical protein